MSLVPLKLSFLLLFCLVLVSGSARASDSWTPPTAEELAMTTSPQAPGAKAIYLFREQITEDKMHMYSVHVRIKVLTDAGKDLANVELRYSHGGRGETALDELAGRTIHPDGTIVPFTGKPYEKLVGRHNESKYMAKVFSLPDVTVGSILEYRYKLRYDDHVFFSPDWYIQEELFTRKVHFLWRPTSEDLIMNDERGQITSRIAWTPILPAGTELHQQRGADGVLTLELTANDIPPIAKEEHMPPLDSFSYRVLFYYTPYRGMDEYWKNEGKYWAKKRDKFIGPGSAVKSAVQEMVKTTDSPEQKLRTIYATTQKLENTDLTRNHSTSEDKAQGLGEIHTTDDILRRKRGSGDEITALFVAMARAAGMKAYLMAVTNRQRSIFYPPYLSTSQLDDDVAIVNYDGKDHYFDPGARFCAFEHLSWQHMRTDGMRQIDGGAALAQTPSEPYTKSQVKRVADLVMDEHGVVNGTVLLTYSGVPSMYWRQLSVSADEAAVRHDLIEQMQGLLPGGMQVTLASLTPLDDYERPMVAKFTVTGPIGSPVGKRLLVPGALFESNRRTTFSSERREQPVDFDYGLLTQDAVRIKLPKTLTIESAPSAAKTGFEKFAGFGMTCETTPDSVTLRRDYALGEFFYKREEYPDLRKFFQAMEAADQQSLVLKQVGGTEAKGGQ